ncbi:MAG: hypothetical protein ABIQ11_02725 [Saprospiraceae bacterium]
MMDKRPALLTWAYCALLISMMACKTDDTPEIFKQHLADNPDIRKKYIYQSVLRLVNIKQDPDFDKLIRDVRKISIYMPPREDSTYQITPLRANLRASTYEELVDVRTAAVDRISLFVDEAHGDPHYVGLLDSTADDYIFEIDGQINLEYLSSLNMAEGSLLDLIK